MDTNQLFQNIRKVRILHELVAASARWKEKACSVLNGIFTVCTCVGTLVTAVNEDAGTLTRWSIAGCAGLMIVSHILNTFGDFTHRRRKHSMVAAEFITLENIVQRADVYCSSDIVYKIVSIRSFRISEQIPPIPVTVLHKMKALNTPPPLPQQRRTSHIFNLTEDLRGGGKDSSESEMSDLSDTISNTIANNNTYRREHRVNLLCSGHTDIASMILANNPSTTKQNMVVDTNHHGVTDVYSSKKTDPLPPV